MLLLFMYRVKTQENPGFVCQSSFYTNHERFMAFICSFTDCNFDSLAIAVFLHGESHERKAGFTLGSLISQSDYFFGGFLINWLSSEFAAV